MTIKAEIIADSISPDGVRLTTLQLRYPRFVHSEFMTHRVFSRNASSSRAIPVERLIQDVIDDPVYPSFWGKNQPGMQAHEECNERVKTWDFDPNHGDSWDRERAWKCARDHAITFAKAFHAAGYHKQIVNRLIEPFCHINVVCTSTEWDNFFELRIHPDAQPEMRLLAEAMRDAMEMSIPRRLTMGQWHLPYVERAFTQEWDDAIKLSVARCARVSYLTHERKEPKIEDDLKLYDRLVGSVPLHASPCEHQARPDTRISGYEAQGTRAEWDNERLHGNLRGWIQFRKLLEQDQWRTNKP